MYLRRNISAKTRSKNDRKGFGVGETYPEEKQMGLGNTKGSRHLSREKEAGSWWVVKFWLPYIGLNKTIFPLLTRWKFQHPPPNRGFAEPKLPTNWRWIPCIISAILNTGLLSSIPEERWENKWGVLACFYPILGQESWTLVVNFLPHCRQWGCISLDKASQPARLLNRELPKEPCCDYGSSLGAVLPTFSSTNRDMNLGLTYLSVSDNRHCC